MRMYRFLLCLYPRLWRLRYEEELLEILASRPLSWREIWDICGGALDAHLHPQLGTTLLAIKERISAMLSTLRRSLLMAFCAYIAFVLAGCGFQKLTESTDLQVLINSQSLLGISFWAVVIGAVVSLLGVLIGGLPVVMGVIRTALRQRRLDLWLLLATPVVAVLVFLGVTLLLVKVVQPDTAPEWQRHLDLILFVALLLLATVVSAWSICLAVSKSDVSVKTFRFATLPSLISLLAMVVVFAGCVSWGLGLRAVAPQIFAGNEGLVGTSTMGSWLGVVLAMFVAVALALFSLLRGLSARSALASA